MLRKKWMGVWKRRLELGDSFYGTCAANSTRPQSGTVPKTSRLPRNACCHWGMSKEQRNFLSTLHVWNVLCRWGWWLWVTTSLMCCALSFMGRLDDVFIFSNTEGLEEELHNVWRDTRSFLWISRPVGWWIQCSDRGHLPCVTSHVSSENLSWVPHDSYPVPLGSSYYGIAINGLKEFNKHLIKHHCKPRESHPPAVHAEDRGHLCMGRWEMTSMSDTAFF